MRKSPCGVLLRDIQMTTDPNLKLVTVMIDRIEGSHVQDAKKAIEEVLAVLKPLRERGLRVRVTRAPSTLKEDKAWR
jgi:hypothetical protein